jgi:hypothetical protein
MSQVGRVSAAYALGVAVRLARGFIQDLVGIVGLGLVAYGAAQIYLPAGAIVAGVEMVGVSYLLARANG